MGKGSKAGKKKPGQKTPRQVANEWRMIQKDIEKRYCRYMLPVAVEEAFILMLSAGLIVLHDEFGFGKQRLARWVDKVLDTRQYINEDYVTFDDLSEEIIRMTGCRYALTRQDIETLQEFAMQGLTEEVRLVNSQAKYMQEKIREGWKSDTNRWGKEVV